MRRTPFLITMAMAMALFLGTGCHSRSQACCPDANGSMTISHGGDDIGNALLGVVLYVTLPMILNQ